MTLKSIHPWGDFEIDDATGLPTVPEAGMFWRVAKVTSIHWEVQLRKYRRFRFSEILERATYNSTTPINEDWVLDGAAYALKGIANGIRERVILPSWGATRQTPSKKTFPKRASPNGPCGSGVCRVR